MSLAAIILSFVILFAIGAALLQMVNALFAQERRYYRWHYHRDILLMDAVLLVMYLLLAGLIVYLYVAFGFEPLVLYCWMALLVSVSVVLLARHIWRHRETMRRDRAIGFSVWFAIVLYLTLFSRISDAGESQTVMTPFRGIAAAVEARSLQPLTHAILNVMLFVPFGFLLPGSNPEALSRAGFAVFGGLIASTLIEGIQMISGLGFCDIDDVIANALGAAGGYVLYRLWTQIQRNWRTF